MKGALILAGGKAVRFNGAKKALVTLNGKPLLQWVINAVRPCVDEIIISGDSDVTQFGYPVVEDTFSQLGPLAGFHAGFSVIKSEYTLVTGCDMPFINPEVISYLFRRGNGHSCCLPKEKEFIEPLCCVYKTADVKTCCSTVINQGKRRLWDLIQCLPDPFYISFAEVETIDPLLLSFRNINALKDLETLQQLAEEMPP